MPEPTATELLHRVVDEVEKAIVGKREVVELAVLTLLCDGHLLIEDIPGVGKTTLAKALARAIGGKFRRIQFTPDLLPADVTGTNVFNPKTLSFELHPGPVFANVVLADEINRATPKTQSSLLECMEERQVTIDGVSHPLPRPYFVIATQNNVEMLGTYPLPEAQMDRFFIRLSLGYPSPRDEANILGRQQYEHPLLHVEQVAQPEQIVQAQRDVRNVLVHEVIRQYIVSLVNATRHHSQVQLGASPRGSLNLMHAAQAHAMLQGRDYVIPDDVKAVAVAVLAHRLILKPEARVRGVDAQQVVQEVLEQVVVPIGVGAHT
ncbi:MAG: MoxR family ATPase [Armatimonadota bacterium]|nr:MoxR family ATPase [bacterium]MCS7309130.1 MoxR family ATPase [Armatimonadota bacterium]MDW8105392.1 MoxR family ATPase [Armatimonadota bacterium]MDW8290958.1 MoxR family ATPase [Armatimonadota bacterium]